MDEGILDARTIADAALSYMSESEVADMARINDLLFDEEDLEEDEDPCWDDYEMVGTKKKGGKEVPNCVPKEGLEERSIFDILNKEEVDALKEDLEFGVSLTDCEPYYDKVYDFYEDDIPLSYKVGGRQAAADLLRARVVEDFGTEIERILNEEQHIDEEITCEGNEFYEMFGWVSMDEKLNEAEYQGRDVTLNKPMRGDVKKFKVYVKNEKGNVVKVNFGDPDMRIKKSDPEARKSFRARHNCDNPGPKTKARYWSCKKW